MFTRNQIQSFTAHGMAASGSAEFDAYFPRKVRIKRYFATSSVDQAASASVVLDATFTNMGTDGSGSTVLAVLTNDSDLADSTTRKSAAWADHVAAVLDTENRPGSPTHEDNTADEIEDGTLIKIAVTKAASATTGDVTVGIEYDESD